MPIFEAGTVVRVPFPYTDQQTRQYRPALVVSARDIGDGGALLWVVMITSANNRRWPGDVALETNHIECGLPVPSLIRTAKLATIDSSAASRVGVIPPAVLAEVQRHIADNLGLR